MLFDKRSSRRRAHRANSDIASSEFGPRARSTAQPNSTSVPPARPENSSSDSAARATRRRLARRDVLKNARPLLDPHGLYGTRTAQRRRAIRRRRAVQQTLIFLIFATAFGAAFWRFLTTRHTSGAPLWSVKLDAQPSAPPAKIADSLFVPTFDGALFSLRNAAFSQAPPRNRVLETAQIPLATRIANADFPIRVAPITVDNSVIYASEDGVVSCRDALSGRQIWRWQSRAAISTRPAIVRAQSANRVLDNAVASAKKPDSSAKTLVVIGNDAGQIVALDARNGAVIWSRALNVPVGSALAVSPSAAQIYVPLMGATGTRGALVSLDARSGAVRWRAETGAACVGAPTAGATMAQGKAPRVFVATDNGALFSFDAANGRRIWKVFARPTVEHSPNLSPNLLQATVLRGEPLLKVYAWGARLFIGGDDGILRCFEVRKGLETWNYAFDAPLLQRPNVRRFAKNDDARSQILAGAGSEICAFDARSGAVEWRARPRNEIVGFASDAQSVQSVSNDGWVENFALD